MNRFLTEFIGTFFLVLTVALSVTLEAPLAALAIGSSLMIMVYMGGHISGGHFNPAVTLAALMRGAMNRGDAAPYWGAQIAGAIVAAGIAAWLTGETFAVLPAAEVDAGRAIAVELLFTFALALVVLSTATVPSVGGNSYYGLAIGFTVFVGAVAGGPISGGAFNPAVAIGPALVSALHGGPGLGQLWIYLAGPLLGGLLAALTFRTLVSEPVAAPA